MKKTLILGLIGLFVLTASAALAANPVVNGGFEDPILADGASAVGAWPEVVVGGWSLGTDATAIYNPLGDGTASDGIAVEEGSNYLRITDDPSRGWDYTAAFAWVPQTIQENHSYTLRFRYGMSSDPSKTWTRMSITFGAVTNPGTWDGWSAFDHPARTGWVGGPGWKTWEYTELVLPGSPKIGKTMLIGLGGDTWMTTDAYYFDNVEVIDTAPVPEPSALVALGGGLVGLAGSMLRRKRTR